MSATVSKAVPSSSWDAYITNLISQTADAEGKTYADSACIFSIEDGTRWTSDHHQSSLRMDYTECRQIAKCFKNKDFSLFETNGVMCAGYHYILLRAQDDKTVFASKGSEYIILQATKTAIVAGHCSLDEKNKLHLLYKGVAAISDYLESLEF